MNPFRPNMDLSVIIVSYNVRHLVLDCLRSLYATAPATLGLEVWVVDNASTDRSADAVAAQFPQVKLIRNSENVGFARANNQAIRASRGRYVLLLNPDTKALPNCLERLVGFMDAHPKAGAAGGKMWDGQGRLQPDVAKRFPRFLTLLAQESLLQRAFPRLQRKLIQDPHWHPDRPTSVDAVSGAMMMLRREALDQVGLLDEDFFMFYEDMELCWRLRRAGWQVRYVPDAEIIHYQDQSSRQMPSRTRRVFQASEQLFAAKCLPPFDAFMVRLCRLTDLGLRAAYAWLGGLVAPAKRQLAAEHLELLRQVLTARRSSPVPHPSTSRLRILMVCADFYPDIFGGLTRVIFELSKRLAARGHEVFLTARRVRPSQPDEEVVDGIRVIRYDFNARNLLLFHATEVWNVRRAVQRLLAGHGVEVLNVHQALPGVGANLAPFARRCANIYTFHAPWSVEWLDMYRFARRGGLSAIPRLSSRAVAFYLKHLERFAVRRADAVVTLSEYVRGKAQQLHGLPDGRFRLIPGGVDCDTFKPAADRAKVRAALPVPVSPMSPVFLQECSPPVADQPAESPKNGQPARLGVAGEGCTPEPQRHWPISPDALLLLTVRRLVPRMGLENLIQAVASLRSKLPHLRLIIVGVGELESELKSLVSRLGLTDRVIFAGKVPEADLPRFYQAADLFVLPTRELEGFGMVTPEALASGTPVLGTPVGGTVEILSKLNPDLLFADTSAEAMAAKIGDFAASGKLTPQLRQACRDHAVQRYSWDAVVDQYEALCRRLLE